MSSKQKYIPNRYGIINTWLTIILVILAVLTGLLAYQNTQLKKTAELPASSYEECTKMMDSMIEESFPPVCVTRFGQRLTLEIIPTEEEEALEQVDMSTWETFDNNIFKLTMKYPQTWGQPTLQYTTTRNRAIFDNNFTITRGVYYQQDREELLSFDEFINQNTPPKRIVTRYLLDDKQARRVTYNFSDTEKAELIALPPNENGEILSISFHHPNDDLPMIREFFGALTSINLDPQDATPTPQIGENSNGCIVTGCSGQVCAEDEVMTTCEYREEYACYENATCERQENGECGWTMTDELQSCLSGSDS